MQSKEAICANLKPLQRAIGMWFKLSNHRILRALYHFLLKLSALFPPTAEPSPQASASPAIGTPSVAAGAVQPVVPAVVSSLAGFSSTGSTWTPPQQPKSSSAIIQSLQALQAKQQPVQQGSGSVSAGGAATGGTAGDEFETLYASLGSVVNDGLSAYEKAPSLVQPALLYCPLLMLRAVTLGQTSGAGTGTGTGSSQPTRPAAGAGVGAGAASGPSGVPSLFVDRFMGPFVRVLFKLAKEHVHPTSNQDAALSPSALSSLNCCSRNP